MAGPRSHAHLRDRYGGPRTWRPEASMGGPVCPLACPPGAQTKGAVGGKQRPHLAFALTQNGIERERPSPILTTSLAYTLHPSKNMQLRIRTRATQNNAFAYTHALLLLTIKIVLRNNAKLTGNRQGKRDEGESHRCH